ncbi:hypothetical protein M9458_048218, partial [Cirrhinus mrigala]
RWTHLLITERNTDSLSTSPGVRRDQISLSTSRTQEDSANTRPNPCARSVAGPAEAL